MLLDNITGTAVNAINWGKAGHECREAIPYTAKPWHKHELGDTIHNMGGTRRRSNAFVDSVLLMPVPNSNRAARRSVYTVNVYMRVASQNGLSTISRRQYKNTNALDFCKGKINKRDACYHKGSTFFTETVSGWSGYITQKRWTIVSLLVIFPSFTRSVKCFTGWHL